MSLIRTYSILDEVDAEAVGIDSASLTESSVTIGSATEVFESTNNEDVLATGDVFSKETTDEKLFSIFPAWSLDLRGGPRLFLFLIIGFFLFETDWTGAFFVEVVATVFTTASRLIFDLLTAREDEKAVVT